MLKIIGQKNHVSLFFTTHAFHTVYIWNTKLLQLTDLEHKQFSSLKNKNVSIKYEIKCSSFEIMLMEVQYKYLILYQIVNNSYSQVLR